MHGRHGEGEGVIESVERTNRITEAPTAHPVDSPLPYPDQVPFHLVLLRNFRLFHAVTF